MATSFAGTPQIFGQDVLKTSTSAQAVLGSYAETADGRGFRYGKAVAATVAGKLYQCTPQDATNYSPAGGLGVSTAAIGATQITISSSITVAANALAGGYLTAAITVGAGYTYKIKSNTAVSATTGMVVTLEDPLVVAFASGTTKVVMTADPWGAVVVMPTTVTAAPAGVSVGIIPAASYGWFQTHGPVAVLNSGGTAIGLSITPGGAEGAVKTGATTLGDIGYCLNAGTTAEYQMVFLNID